MNQTVKITAYDGKETNAFLPAKSAQRNIVFDGGVLMYVAGGDVKILARVALGTELLIEAENVLPTGPTEDTVLA